MTHKLKKVNRVKGKISEYIDREGEKLEKEGWEKNVRNLHLSTAFHGFYSSSLGELPSEILLGYLPNYILL